MKLRFDLRFFPALQEIDLKENKELRLRNEERLRNLKKLRKLYETSGVKGLKHGTF
jgi:hypothetical protein